MALPLLFYMKGIAVWSLQIVGETKGVYVALFPPALGQTYFAAGPPWAVWSWEGRSSPAPQPPAWGGSLEPLSPPKRNVGIKPGEIKGFPTLLWPLTPGWQSRIWNAMSSVVRWPEYSQKRGGITSVRTEELFWKPSACCDLKLLHKISQTNATISYKEGQEE